MLSFFLNIVEITVGISLLVLVMLLVLKLFGGKFTSKCRYVLWTLVLLRLAIPFSFNILPSIIEIPIHSVAVGEEQNEVVEDPTQNEIPPQSDEWGSTSETPDTTLTPGTTNPTNPGTTSTPTYPTTPVNPTNPGTTTPSNPTVPVNPSVPSVDVDEPFINDTPREEVSIPDPIPETPKEPISVIKILEVVSVIYLIGAVIFFCWNVFSYLLYTRRILKSARNADAKTIGIFLSICDKENLKKVPVLLVSPEINSPAAFGIFRRKIVLPDITFTQNGLAGTLFHEVVHCKRGDLYIKVIELVARSLHWFNPLSHIAAVRCEMEMEMSCDETVLDGCNDDARAAYGNVMLDIIRRCRRNKGTLTTHFNPKKNSVKSRFANIINGSGSRRGKVLIPICLVLCILAGTIVACTVGDDTPILKEYKINVLVDEELDGADGYNRDIHIIEVELDSEHETEINETISAYFLDFYNEYMNSPGSAYDFPYQLIDTSYTVKNNILAITGVSRYSATSVPWSMVRSIFYDLENDKLCTVQEYFEATGLDWDKARNQALKMLKTHSQYEHLVWEISGVVYNEADEPVLVVKADNTNIYSEQIKYVYLIGYDFDEYCITNENRSFDGFDEMVWRDIPIVISAEYPSDEFLENYDESKIIDATSDEYAVYYVITSNVDVENTQITELIWNDSKLTDSVPLHKFDLKAGEPVVIMVSHPGAISNRALTYTDTFGVYRRFEITRSGEDGSPILIEITQDRLTEYFKASDLLAGEIKEYKLLIKDNNSEASLYYYYNGIESDFATKFRISADGHELDITTSLPAWLKNTWEPQIYRSNVTSDGGDRLFLIFTTGTGTGVHIEEAYAMNCFDGEIYAVPNPYEWVESVVSRGEDGKTWTVNSSGDKIELPDNAYFDQNFDFFVKNGKLYAKVLIGYGTWQYTEDYFLIEYGYNASGKIIAKSIKHSSEVDESFESTNLPRDFVNTYHTAEYFYAIFNGCARIEFYEETIEYEGEKYRNCSHVEFSNLAEMRNVIVRHFSDDITNSLMSKTVSGIGCPLYIEQDGKLYIFAGYAAQWGYSSATGYSFEPLGYENGEYLVRVFASINEYGVKYVAGDVCKYVIEADGSIRFTQFPLMIDLLWDAFAGEEEDVAPIPPVNVLSNPKDYSVQTVYIPVSESGRSSAYPYSDSQMLYMTFDLVTDAQGVTQAYSNIKLYLVDKERGRIVSECAIDGEYQLNAVSYDPTGNGVVLMDVEYSHDAGYIVHGAYHVLYSGGELTATKVDSAAYPQHYMPVRGNSWDGLVYAYRTTDDGVGRGGIDLRFPDGTVKRILSNVVLDDAGGNLSNVMYYTPVGVIGATVDENAKLVYNIGAYEGAGKGFGIYDIATGKREEFLYMNYRAIDVWSNSIYFEEYKRTDEGYSESYRIWKRDRHGNMTLLWSNDPADGEAYHEGKSFPTFNNGLWYFYSYPDIEVPSYINSSGYAKTEICHGDNFDPIVTVLYPYTVDRYSSNLLVTTSGRATVVLRVPESIIPPSVTTIEFSTIEELIAKFESEIDAFTPGYYARQEFLEAVDKFINPAAHQDSMTKSEYAALAGMRLQDISATYDRSSGKMYLNFTVTGEPVGSLKKGENTAEICENMYGIGVVCGDTSENNANEARSAVSKYLHWVGFNGMPDSTWSGAYNFTDYMASCLNDIGKTPTKDAIVDYAERCFGISGYSPLPSQFDASGNHVQIGYGFSVTNFIITGDTVKNGIHTVTVDVYRDSFYYDKYQTVVFRITKLSDGAWKFVEVAEVSDTPLKETDTAETDAPETTAPETEVPFDPEEFAAEISKKSGSIVTAHGTPIGGWIHYYFPAILSSAQRITVYYTTDFGLSTYTTTAPLPEGVEFDYGKVVAAGSGAGSGECMFILRLEKDDEVTFWSYMNFAGEEVNEFELLGEITRENVHRYGRTWSELLSLTSDIPLGFEPSAYKSYLEEITGKEVLFWHKIFSNPVYLYFVPCDTGTLEFTVYVYKDYSMVTNRDGEGLSELKLHLPDIFKFGDVTCDIIICDSIEPIWAGGGGGSGECRFVVKLTKGDEVAYIYYNNFHYETDILDFRYAGGVPVQDLEYFMEEYPEIFGDIAEHTHIFYEPAYYTNFTSDEDGKIYHNKYKDCALCGQQVNLGVVLCGYQDPDGCTGGCQAHQ